jgi:glycosyltransferase involved in cell wall biosynthesis
MSTFIADADIVIDQLLLGSYGVAACEAMAAGRAVIGNVDDHVREVVRQASGFELPIIQATPDDLEQVLARLACDPSELSEAARRGPSFVGAVHSGAHTLKAMRGFLGLEGRA